MMCPDGHITCAISCSHRHMLWLQLAGSPRQVISLVYLWLSESLANVIGKLVQLFKVKLTRVDPTPLVAVSFGRPVGRQIGVAGDI